MSSPNIDLFFHMKNHYKRLKSVQSVVDTGRSRLAQFQEKRNKKTRKKINVTKNSHKSKSSSSSRPQTRRNPAEIPTPQGSARSTNKPTKTSKEVEKVDTKEPDQKLEGSEEISEDNKRFEILESFELDFLSPENDEIINKGTEENFETNISPDTIPSGSRSKEQALQTILSVKESATDHEYAQFLLHITEDIIRNECYTTEMIQSVFTSHIEANKNHLDYSKMIKKIAQLCQEIDLPFGFTDVGNIFECSSTSDLIVKQKEEKKCDFQGTLLEQNKLDTVNVIDCNRPSLRIEEKLDNELENSYRVSEKSLYSFKLSSSLVHVKADDNSTSCPVVIKEKEGRKEKMPSTTLAEILEKKEETFHEQYKEQLPDEVKGRRKKIEEQNGKEEVNGNCSEMDTGKKMSGSIEGNVTINVVNQINDCLQRMESFMLQLCQAYTNPPNIPEKVAESSAPTEQLPCFPFPNPQKHIKHGGNNTTPGNNLFGNGPTEGLTDMTDPSYNDKNREEPIEIIKPPKELANDECVGKYPGFIVPFVNNFTTTTTWDLPSETPSSSTDAGNSPKVISAVHRQDKKCLQSRARREQKTAIGIQCKTCNCGEIENVTTPRHDKTEKCPIEAVETNFIQDKRPLLVDAGVQYEKVSEKDNSIRTSDCFEKDLINFKEALSKCERSEDNSWDSKIMEYKMFLQEIFKKCELFHPIKDNQKTQQNEEVPQKDGNKKESINCKNGIEDTNSFKNCSINEYKTMLQVLFEKYQIDNPRNTNCIAGVDKLKNSGTVTPSPPKQYQTVGCQKEKSETTNKMLYISPKYENWPVFSKQQKAERPFHEGIMRDAYTSMSNTKQFYPAIYCKNNKNTLLAANGSQKESFLLGNAYENVTAKMHDSPLPLILAHFFPSTGTQTSEEDKQIAYKKLSEIINEEKTKQLINEMKIQQPPKEEEKEPPKNDENKPPKEEKKPSIKEEKEPPKRDENKPAKEEEKKPPREKKEPAIEEGKESPKEEEKEPPKEEKREPHKEEKREPHKEEKKEPHKEEDNEPSIEEELPAEDDNGDEPNQTHSKKVSRSAAEEMQLENVNDTNYFSASDFKEVFGEHESENLNLMDTSENMIESIGQNNVEIKESINSEKEVDDFDSLREYPTRKSTGSSTSDSLRESEINQKIIEFIPSEELNCCGRRKKQKNISTDDVGSSKKSEGNSPKPITIVENEVNMGQTPKPHMDLRDLRKSISKHKRDLSIEDNEERRERLSLLQDKTIRKLMYDVTSEDQTNSTGNRKLTDKNIEMIKKKLDPRNSMESQNEMDEEQGLKRDKLFYNTEKAREKLRARSYMFDEVPEVRKAKQKSKRATTMIPSDDSIENL